jgi:hypothetical protein
MRSSPFCGGAARALEGEIAAADRKPPRPRWLPLGGALLAVLAVEAVARVSLWVTRGESTVGLSERTLYLQYRPFVMFGPDWDATMGNLRRPVRDGRYRVLLLGAATGEAFPPHMLEEELAKRFPGRTFEVVNAASGGYNARQELILAALWGSKLRLDMILSLDGANDLRHRLEWIARALSSSIRLMP